MTYQTDQVVAGHRLRAPLGSGSGGSVWLAEFGGQPVALKLFDREQLGPRIGAESVAQYALSRDDDPRARLFARAEHFDLDTDPPYLRMEQVEGPSLREALVAGPLPEPRVRELARALLDALAYAHRRGFVHGDLKPANILLPTSGDAPIKLIDAGFGQLLAEPVGAPAEAVDHSLASLPEGGVGTPRYAPPERWTSEYRDPRVATAADLYMAGKVIYEALTGKHPATIVPPSRIDKTLAHWDDLLFALVEEQPRRRPDATEALAQVAAFPAAGRAPRPAPQRAVSATPVALRAAKAPSGPPVEPIDATRWMLMAGLYLMLPLAGLIALLLIPRVENPFPVRPKPPIPDPVPPPPPPPPPGPTAAQLLSQAKAHEDAGRTDAAEAIHRQLLRTHPPAVESRVWLAQQAAEAGQLGEARAQFAAALRFRPRHVEANYGMARVLAMQKQLPQALRHAERAARDSKHAPTHNLVGELRLAMGQHGGAIQAFHDAAACDPDNAGVRMNLGIAFLQTQRPRQARTAFEQALAIEPNQPIALHNLAVIDCQSGRVDLARQWLLRLGRIDPDQALQAISRLPLEDDEKRQLDAWLRPQLR